jgi:hypothetical protein
MTGPRMQWDLVAKLRGRQTMDLKHETDLRSRDRAAKWLAVVEGKAQQRSRPREVWRSTTQSSR